MGETNTVLLEYDDGTIGSYEFDGRRAEDLVEAAVYGSGWARFDDGGATMLVNLDHVRNVKVVPHAREGGPR